MRPNEIIIQSDKFKFITPAITIDDKIIATSDIEVNKNILFGKNVIMNESEWKINNIHIKYENCDFAFIGKISFYHLHINEDELRISGKRTIFDMTDVSFRMNEKNYLQIKDNVMHFENTILSVNGEIQLGNLILSPDFIKSKNSQVMISDEKIELKNIPFIKNGGYIEVKENEIEIKNSRLLFSGEITINDVFTSKNGIINIYDGIMNFENSRLQIGGFNATKEGITMNQTPFKLENSSFFKNNMIMKL